MKLLAMTAAAVALATGPAIAQDATKIEVDSSEGLGQYLVTGEGRPVYIFTADTQGTDDQEPAIACASEECLEIWPLVTTTGEPQTQGAADASLLGTTEFGDEQVVTYNGWPLYHFARDVGRWRPQGNDIGSFGGEWYLLRPSGAFVHE